MYTLKEWWNISIGEDPVKDWDGKVYCTPSNAEMTMHPPGRNYHTPYITQGVALGYMIVGLSDRHSTVVV